MVMSEQKTIKSSGFDKLNDMESFWEVSQKGFYVSENELEMHFFSLK